MPKMTIKLRRFCDGQDLLRLAYIDGGGHPRVVPTYFIRVADSFVIGTWDASAKWRYIRKNAKVGWVIDGGTNTYNFRGASMWGFAAEITEPRLQRRVRLELSMKYFGSTQHPRAIQLFAGSGCIFIKLIPEGFYTWDNASSKNQLRKKKRANGGRRSSD